MRMLCFGCDCSRVYCYSTDSHTLRCHLQRFYQSLVRSHASTGIDFPVANLTRIDKEIIAGGLYAEVKVERLVGFAPMQALPILLSAFG